MAGIQQMGIEELHGRLQEFDRAVALKFPGQRFRIVLVGGGAMVLLGVLYRATSDLDALVFPTELVSLMEQFDLSGRVTAYMDHFAYDMEDRLARVDVDTTAIECLTASLEDLVASKLHSDRPVDVRDVRRPEVLAALDWTRLEQVVGEMEASCLSTRRYREFVDRYRAYREECGSCAD